MKKYNIFINPKELKELHSNDWSDERVKAVLMFSSNKYKANLCFRGYHIRELRKKSYDLIFTKANFLNQTRMLHLNAEYNDPSLIRNKLSMDFFNSIGVLSPSAEHVLLYINGVFQGVYLQLESMDESSLVRRNLPKGPIFYATNNDANFSLLTAEGNPKSTLLDGYTKKYGNEDAEDSLTDLLVKINTLPNDEFFVEIQKVLHVNQYLTWLAGVVCTQNLDGFENNYALYQNSETGLFEISPWDFDATWGRDIHGEPLEYDYVSITGENTLTARILHFPKFRQEYKEILSNILDHEFTVSRQLPKIHSLLELIMPYLKKDPYYIKKDVHLEEEISIFTDFIQQRRSYLQSKLSTLK